VSRRQREIVRRFTERYGLQHGDVLDRIESKVIGETFGANGYTTKAQADSLIEALEIQACHRVLDLGAGRGWPGVYLARQTGCEVVLADLPRPALRSALNRASHHGLERRVDAVVADGESLPFSRDSFDHVIHADTL
jgi:ubiquinone/menaquinone biosynthesis C-methylase UbiE